MHDCYPIKSIWISQSTLCCEFKNDKQKTRFLSSKYNKIKAAKSRSTMQESNLSFEVSKERLVFANTSSINKILKLSYFFLCKIAQWWNTFSDIQRIQTSSTWEQPPSLKHRENAKQVNGQQGLDQMLKQVLSMMSDWLLLVLSVTKCHLIGSFQKQKHAYWKD